MTARLPWAVVFWADAVAALALMELARTVVGAFPWRALWWL